MKRIDVTTAGWDTYELIDTGEGRKLERFGEIILDRPDPQAIWHKLQEGVWQDADAQFLWSQAKERWSVAKDVPESWNMAIGDIVLSLSLKGFKHIGVFPEHAAQWRELQTLGKEHPGLRMLNLFGYTGAASIAGALAGMKVTHVDASKQTMQTVKDNIELSNLPKDSIRLIVEDALRYAKRLNERGEQFDVIVMDPPAFGRGPKGEVWKIEEKLTELLSVVSKLLSSEAQLLIVNGYAAGFSARAFGELVQEVAPKGGDVVYGDVGIAQNDTDRILPTGIYASWKR